MLIKKRTLVLSSLLIIIPRAYATHFDMYFNQANEFFKKSDLKLAIPAYRKSLELNPCCHQAWYNLGLIYLQQKQYDAAVEQFTQALVLSPTYTKARLELGNTFLKQKKFTQAIEQFKAVLEAEPNCLEAQISIAKTLSENSQFDAALHYFNIAHKQNPQDTNLLLDFANTLNMNNQTEQALATYFTLLELVPNNVSVLYNIAYTLKKLNRVQDAMPYYAAVLKQDPNHIDAHFSLSLAYLISGNFEQGWPEYEWRFKRSIARTIHNKPRWDGSALHGKTIVLHAEQGLGDTLQFIRYAALLKEQGATVIAAVQPPLIQLIALCPYIDKVVGLHNTLPAHDYQIPLMSLPLVLKTREHTIPHDIPYLFADSALVDEWHTKLADDNNFKVGICWQGNSGYSTHFLRTAVAAKSINLVRCLPLLTIPGVTVYNLQKTTGEEQVAQLAADTSLVNFDADFDNSHGRFMDTAAVMKNLDLMITVDTSIAHLAGGLGIPTWVLLPEPADWRWMLNRTDTPWYPNAHLFRQPTCGDWESVIETIKHKLIALRNAKKNKLRV